MTAVEMLERRGAADVARAVGEPPVAIVGGGPVGMTLALLLAGFGVRSLIVERRSSTSRHPKARGVNARSMEIFRQLGLEAELRRGAEPVHRVAWFGTGSAVFAEDAERKSFAAADMDDRSRTAAPGIVTSQDVVEDVLFHAVRRSPLISAVWGTEAALISTSAEGTTLSLRDGVTGQERRTTARFVVAADGARSPIRTALGVGWTGADEAQHNLNVLFEADLKDRMAELSCAFHAVRNDQGLFVVAGCPTGPSDDQWTFNFPYNPERGETAASYSPERLEALIRQTLGLPDLSLRILNVSEWQAAAVVADRLQIGSVFLAGDAAHLMPPAGALGMNTGLMDAHNLAWKLAAVLTGQADAALLDTYAQERRAAAAEIVGIADGNFDRIVKQGPRGSVWEGSQQDLVLGFRYDRGAFLPDAAGRGRDFASASPLATPGGRAPHAWLDRRLGRSTVDLYGWTWVLLSAERGLWRRAAAAASREPGVVVTHWALSDIALKGDPSADILDRHGLGPDGAVLVRPDGVIAWRAGRPPETPEAALAEVLTGLLRPLTA